MTRRPLFILLLMTLFFSGCEYRRYNVSGMPDTPYHKTLERLTKHDRLYGLDKNLYETYITYYSPELAMQYIDEYAKVFVLSDAKKKQMIDEENVALSKYDQFMVAHYASEDDNQRLTSKDPSKIVWKFFSLSAGETQPTVEPVEITPIEIGTQTNFFYPHLSSWTKFFRVRFPKNNSSEKKLVMKGPIRELTFVWK